MRLLIDENMSSRRLAVRLLSAGHEVVLATDVGVGSVADARVLAWALNERGIATALGNLESSGVAVTDGIHVLNHWR